MRPYLATSLTLASAAALLLAGPSASAPNDTASRIPQITWGLSDGQLVRTTAVRFHFSASHHVPFECSLDRRPYQPCTSPFRANVGTGEHAFAVRSTGHSDAATRTWTVSPRYNPSHGHQCTTWAYEKRPEIFDFSQAVAFSPNWRAARWARNARRAGFPVDHRPAIGDVAVWPSRYEGASAAGHLAYVTKVRTDGAITVSEMNSTAGRRISKWVDVATVPAGIASHLQYIHQLP